MKAIHGQLQKKIKNPNSGSQHTHTNVITQQIHTLPKGARQQSLALAPGRTGRDLSRRADQHGRTTHLKKLALSASPLEEEEQQLARISNIKICF